MTEIKENQEETLSTLSREQLIEQLNAYITATGTTQAKLAKRLNMNAGALSAWLKDEYAGNSEVIDKAVSLFLQLQQAKNKDSIAELGFVHTSISRKIFNIAQNCQIDNEIGICYGAAGLGKTTAIKEYAKNNSGVIVIESEERMPIKTLIEKLYVKLNLGTEKNWDLQDMKEKILKKLKDSGWLIIIDEAEHLREESFTVLRRLHDFSDCTFGLLFIGITKLYNNLIKLKGEYMYLVSRIGYRTSLDDLKAEDVKAIVSSVIPDNEIWQEFEKTSNGNARILTKTLKRALKLAKSNNTEVTADYIDRSRSLMLV